MTRTLITGASGFIGTRATEMAPQRGPVCAVVRSPPAVPPAADVETALWDGSTPALRGIFDQFRPDRVLHLAAHYTREHTPDDVGPLIDANVRVAAQVLDCCGDAAVVLATTHFMHHGEPGRALNLYAATKLAMLEIARYYGDARQCRWAAVSFYDVYGPHDSRRKLIEVTIDASLAGTPLAIPADDHQIRPLYVDDAVRALHAAADAIDDDPGWVGTEFFASPREATTVTEVITAVEAVTGRPVSIADTPYETPARSIATPIAPAPQPPGWEPVVSLAEGIDAIVQSLSR